MLPIPALSTAVAPDATREAVTSLVAAAACVAALIVLYAVYLDQGMLLSPMLGKAAATANYVHELAHDGRHLLGAPCH